MSLSKLSDKELLYLYSSTRRLVALLSMDEEEIKTLHAILQSILQNSVIRDQFSRTSKTLSIVPSCESLEQRVAFIKKCLSVYQKSKSHFTPDVQPTGEQYSPLQITSDVTVSLETVTDLNDLPQSLRDDIIIEPDLPYPWQI